MRLAVVDALPTTGGDWQEGAAALVGIDADPRVRKKLVEVMRYTAWPHNIDGLRMAFTDEVATVRVAAARTTGFVRDGAGLYNERMNGSFDDDWDMRAASVQALGQLRAAAARDRLVGMLADDRAEVRLQVLVALDRIDPEGLRRLPELERLARERDHWKIASVASRMMKEMKEMNEMKEMREMREMKEIKEVEQDRQNMDGGESAPRIASASTGAGSMSGRP